MVGRETPIGLLQVDASSACERIGRIGSLRSGYRLCRTHWRTLVFVAYLVVVCITMVFHEPWFDEAQSWLIARDGSYRDMLLIRPHYEGHPPLWWLMLSIPAKTGVPYEWGLKGVELLCSALMAGILVFRSPLPRLMTALLPFTYFLCYQYGVTSRPYALLCAALFIAADCWRSRDEHPWRLTLALALLCATSSYGIVLACAFALVWVARVAIAGRRGRAGKTSPADGLPDGSPDGSPGVADTASKAAPCLRALVADSGRFAAWLLLMIVGIAVTVCILPWSDTFGANPDGGVASALSQFVLFWVVVPSESMFTAFVGDSSLHAVRLGIPQLLLCVALSALIWAALIRLARRRGNLDILLATYTMLALFATRYFSMHHLGIVFALFIAQLWIGAREKPLSLSDLPFISDSVKSHMRRIRTDARMPESSESGAKRTERDISGVCERPVETSCGRPLSACGMRGKPMPTMRGTWLARIVVIIALLPSLIWTANSVICDIRYDYSGARALASFIRRNGLERDRWVSMWRYFPDMYWPDGTHTDRMEDTHRYSWPVLAANPYFSRNLLDCTYQGLAYVPNEVPAKRQMNQEIARCEAKGRPQIIVGDTDFPAYFFKRLGLHMSDYHTVVVATKHVPWKTWVVTDDVAIYVRNDVRIRVG